jgi:hypothetical protein
VAARRSVPPPSLPNVDQGQAKVQIPSWDLDPVWSLAPWPVTIQLGSVEVEIPAMSAAEWLAILMSEHFSLGTLLDLIPGIDDLILDDVVDLDEVSNVLTDLITTVSSRQWWITLRLVGVAKRHWDKLGPEMITSVDATRVSLAAWMNVLQLTVIRSIDPMNATMFIAQVQAPPPGVVAPETSRQDLSRREFLAIAG